MRTHCSQLLKIVTACVWQARLSSWSITLRPVSRRYFTLRLLIYSGSFSWCSFTSILWYVFLIYTYEWLISSWKYLVKSSAIYTSLNETLVVIIPVKSFKETNLLIYLWGMTIHSRTQAYMKVDIYCIILIIYLFLFEEILSFFWCKTLKFFGKSVYHLLPFKQTFIHCTHSVCTQSTVFKVATNVTLYGIKRPIFWMKIKCV